MALLSGGERNIFSMKNLYLWTAFHHKNAHSPRQVANVCPPMHKPMSSVRFTSVFRPMCVPPMKTYELSGLYNRTQPMRVPP